MYVEVNAKEALEAYADGKRVVCLERDDDIKGVVNAFSLASLLNGFAFLVDKAEPVKHDHVLADENGACDAPVLPPPLKQNANLCKVNAKLMSNPKSRPAVQKSMLERY